jgi:anti-sigma-K factor RskA
MRHLSQELLAGIALGEPDPTSRRDRAHLLICRRCSADLAELRKIAATGRAAIREEIRPPKPSVLARIQAEVAGDEPVAREHQLGTPFVTPVDVPGSRVAVRPRHRLALAAGLAAALVAIALGGVVWRAQAAGDVVARATLTPLPDKSGRGTAELIRKDGAEQLSISVDAHVVGSGFEELWLINTDGRRMISLGVVPVGGHASYPVPTPATGSLQGYTIVDISLEPFDGNAAHSRNSVLRGTLD